MSLTSPNLDQLQKKIATLESENKLLRAEVSQLARATDDIEEEKQIMLLNWKDQLKTARDENNTLLLELNRLKKENESQNEKMDTLEASLSHAHEQIKHLSIENVEKTTLVTFTTEIQSSLAIELADCMASYKEVLTILEEIKQKPQNQKKRTQPSIRRSLIPAIAALAHTPANSLHAELIQSSLFNEYSLDSGIASNHGSGYNHTDAYKKTFEMVRSVNKTTGNSSPAQPRVSSCQGGTFSDESLEAAWKRLTPVRHTMLSHASPGPCSYDENSNAARDGVRTPDNSSSTGSSNMTSLSNCSQSCRKKIELVASLDDSVTLQQWTRLATPSLAVVLVGSPGVRVRAGRTLDEIDSHTYSSSDVEEDAIEVKPDQQYQMSKRVYTCMTSAVMHSNHETASISTSRQSSQVDNSSMKSVIPMDQHRVDIAAVTKLFRSIQQWIVNSRPWQHPPEQFIRQSKAIKGRPQQKHSSN